MTRRKEKPLPPPPKVYSSTCVYNVGNGMQCTLPSVEYGHCAKHVAHAPEERGVYMAICDEVSKAESKLREVGDEILRVHVVAETREPVPLDVQRTYRALWHRRNYLRSLQQSHVPGEPIPMEMYMRESES